MARLTIVSIFSQLSLVSLIFIDNVMAGQHSKETLAATGLSTFILIPILVLNMGVFLSLNPMISRLLGKKSYKEIGDVIINSIFLAILMAVISILLLMNIEPLLVWFDIQVSLIPAINGYLGAAAYGILPYLIYLVLKFSNEGLLQAKNVMLCSLSALPFKVLFNYIFIFGAFGVESQGAPGAGIATALSWGVLCIAIIILTVKHPNFKKFIIFEQLPRINITVLKELFTIGIPITISLSTGVTIFSVIGLYIGSISTDAVAAHQAANNIVFIFAMVINGVAVAITSRIGYMIGKDDLVRVKDLIKISLIFALFVAVFNAAVIVFFSDVLAKLYTNDEKLITMIVGLLSWAAIIQFPRALEDSISAVLRGFKITRSPAVVYVICFTIGLPVGHKLAFEYDMSVTGFWVGLLISHCLSATGILILLLIQLKSIFSNNGETSIFNKEDDGYV